MTGRGVLVTGGAGYIGSHACKALADHGPRRPGDPARPVSDASRARRELGWAPGMTDLDMIVRTAWHWMRARRAGTVPA